MRLAHLGQMDVNLLVSLDALLGEGSVGRAAARVGLSQPAMSRALGRLRAHLGDDLLVRSGRGMSLTPRARALAAPLRRALAELDAVVGARPTFEPTTARRTFTLGTADYGAAVLVPPLLDRLAREAPGVVLAVHAVPDDLGAALEAGVPDLVAIPRRAGPGLVWRTILTERFVCIARRDHPRIRRRLTLDAFCALGHVVVTPSGRPGNPLDELLRRRGRTRHVALTVPSFLVAPLAVASSQLIATTPARIARRFAALPLQVHATPLEVPGFTIALGFHERFRTDPAHAWFRRFVAECGGGSI